MKLLCPPTKSKVPKAVISMKDLNAVFQPEKIRHAHGLQISYLHGEQMRNLFVYHDDGYVSHFALPGVKSAASDICNLSH